MNDWGAVTYGDPCRECGFAWTTTLDEAVVVIAKCPTVLKGLLHGASGDERRPDLAWSVRAYVCHVADNLRIWAERLVGVRDGGPSEVGGYDENELARARHYDSVALRAAQWSLARSVKDWLGAVNASPRTGTLMVHPERGELTLLDVTARTPTTPSTTSMTSRRRSPANQASALPPSLGNRLARSPSADAERVQARLTRCVLNRSSQRLGRTLVRVSSSRGFVEVGR